jgi:hypothetical protein
VELLILFYFMEVIMKKFFGLLNIVFFAALLMTACQQPVDKEKEVEYEYINGELKSAPSAFYFTFDPTPLVYKAKDTISGGATVGTLTALGGSGAPYTFEVVDDGGEDYALFEAVGTELKISGATTFELLPEHYAVPVRVTDSEGATFQKYCHMEVTLSPSLIKKAPKLYPYIVTDTTNKIKVKWDKSTGADGYRIYINDTGTEPASAATADYTFITGSAEYTSREYEITTYDSAALPRDKTYYVWVDAYNEEGATPLSPRTKGKTFCTVDPFWYEGVKEWYMADLYKVTATIVMYGFGAVTGYVGEIVHHELFDPADIAAIPALEWSKYGENIGGKPAGVCVLKIIEGENYSATDYSAVYYWGRGFQQTDSDGITYTRSYIINTFMYAPGNDGFDYEKAIDDYSLERFSVHNANVAAPYTRIMLDE